MEELWDWLERVLLAFMGVAVAYLVGVVSREARWSTGEALGAGLMVVFGAAWLCCVLGWMIAAVRSHG